MESDAWENTDILVTKERLVVYTHTLKGYHPIKPIIERKEFLLTETQYREFMKRLSESPLYEPAYNRGVYANTYLDLSLYLKGRYLKNSSKMFSRSLSNFLLKEILGEVEEVNKD